MENASKALLMAGGVLISLLVIGALILMFSNLTNYQGTETQSTREAQIQKFNEEYETYNRNDVRGSDIYSLINKVVSYNRRKTTSTEKSTDEGNDLQYQPMSLTISFENSTEIQNDFTYTFATTADNKIRLLNSNIVKNNNKIEVTEANTNILQKNMIDVIRQLEKDYGGSSSLVNLTTGIANLFDISNSDPKSEEKMTKAIELWNNNAKSKKIPINDTDSIVDKYKYLNTTNNKDDIGTYYEYVHFKRAHFDCKNTTYNNQTGRIISMEFKYNGKIN